MAKVKINDIEHEVEDGMTVLQACEQAGVEIPRFCYHDRLSIAGNCRMCLVEVKPGPPKPQASCALPVMNGQEIYTNTEKVEKARKGVLEFLLINHPLDCPICDQGGECDLQDQTMAYGPDTSRYDENKRAVKNKYMGPLINTIMTRCIHCTRCVRFATEVAGVNALGLLNRGESAEISALEQAVDSELSANVIDLCPVGALTSKPYAFVARPWELRKTETIDVMDAVGCNIRMDSRGNEILRILPRLHEDINEEWISDKSRYSCDGLTRQRLDRAFMRDGNGKLQPTSWQDALNKIADHIKAIKPSEIAAVAGDYQDCESLFAFKSLADKLKITNIDALYDDMALNQQYGRGGYLFNTSIAGIEEADYLLIIGANPRWEAPLVNARIRKSWLANNLKIAMIGDKIDLTYPYDYYDNRPSLLNEILKGKHDIAKALKAAKKPMIIVGGQAISGDNGLEIYNASLAIAQQYKMIGDDWNGFNILHQYASRVGALDIGFIPDDNAKIKARDYPSALAKGKLKQLWLLGCDDYLLLHDHQEKLTKRPKDSLLIYVGHHGDVGAHLADVILPSAAYSEKQGTYVNLEGRVQLAQRAVFPPNDAKEEWAIYRALSQILDKPLSFDDLPALQAKMRKAYPHLANIDHLEHETISDFKADKQYNISAEKFNYAINDFYMSDVLSRASLTMAQCSQELTSKKHESDARKIA